MSSVTSVPSCKNSGPVPDGSDEFADIPPRWRRVIEFLFHLAILWAQLQLWFTFKRVCCYCKPHHRISGFPWARSTSHICCERQLAAELEKIKFENRRLREGRHDCGLHPVRPRPSTETPEP